MGAVSFVIASGLLDSNFVPISNWIYKANISYEITFEDSGNDTMYWYVGPVDRAWRPHGKGVVEVLEEKKEYKVNFKNGILIS
jgi:hypothetical protein